jgi:phosphoethanolamine N-methyltransferase
LKDAGFDNVNLVNRNPWYTELSHCELNFLTGETRVELERKHGPEIVAHMAEIWVAMVKVLESGEHCPHHLRGQRPL